MAIEKWRERMTVFAQYLQNALPGACEVREDGYTRWNRVRDRRQFYNVQKLPVAGLEDVMETLLVKAPAHGGRSSKN